MTADTSLFGWQGANNRIRMGVIGMGTRAGARVRFADPPRGLPVHRRLRGERRPSCRRSRPANRPLAPELDVVGDYRRVLDRNDIDAVLIATPDFSHAKIMVDAIAAGKDVYVEKPVSNSVPRINAMLDAYKKSNQVVQVGTHQRSWDHFIEAKKILDSGVLGPVTHVHHPAGGQLRAAEAGAGAGAARPRLGRVAGGRAEEAVQAGLPRRSAPGGSTAAAWSATGARTTSTSPTGS